MLGFVTGLKAEARLLRRLPVLTAIGGGLPEGAARAAAALVRQDVQALISFGLAGGLDPALPPGTLIIPRQIAAANRLHDCDTALLARLGGATCDLLLGGTSIAATIAEKAALFQATQASALDLESGAVGAVAREHGLPFAVLRAIADPAGRPLPEAALLALDPQGRIALPRIAGSLFRNPGQITQLITLAADAARARRTLAARAAEIDLSARHDQEALPPAPTRIGS